MNSELEKLESVSEKSQAIGEFLEWLFGSKTKLVERVRGEEKEK